MAAQQKVSAKGDDLVNGSDGAEELASLSKTKVYRQKKKNQEHVETRSLFPVGGTSARARIANRIGQQSID
jgi:hypothetical protein